MRLSKLDVESVDPRLLGFVLDMDRAVKVLLKPHLRPTWALHECVQTPRDPRTPGVHEELVRDKTPPIDEGGAGDFDPGEDGLGVIRPIPHDVEGEGGPWNIPPKELNVHSVGAGEHGGVGRLDYTALQVLELEVWS